MPFAVRVVADISHGLRARSQRATTRTEPTNDADEALSNLRDLRDSIDNIDAAVNHMGLGAEQQECSRSSPSHPQNDQSIDRETLAFNIGGKM
jgi:hypothetical protein